MVISVNPTCLSWRASSELYNPFLPPRLPRIYTFILTTLVYWYYAYLLSFTLICCIFSKCMLVQNNLVKLNYVERGLSRLCGGHGNSHMRFYDVTSWSYVNLDDPDIDYACDDRKATPTGNHYLGLARLLQGGRVWSNWPCKTCCNTHPNWDGRWVPSQSQSTCTRVYCHSTQGRLPLMDGECACWPLAEEISSCRQTDNPRSDR